MAQIWSSQPFKAIHMLYSLLKLLVYLALFSVKYAFTSQRPVPGWGLKNHLICIALRSCLYTTTKTKTFLLFSAKPEKAKQRWIRIEPPSKEYFTGVLAASDVVKPAPVDAIWFPSPPPKDASQRKHLRIVIYFHAGGYAYSFGHKPQGSQVAGTLASHMRADRTVWAQYRLTGTSSTRFPAALQDGLTLYNHVVSLGVDPRNIVLSGESAGGNLALALIRYLQSSRSLPLPGGAALFSPWLSIPRTTVQVPEDSRANLSHFIPSEILNLWGSALWPELKPSVDPDMYLAPIHHPFKVSIPLFLQTGSVDQFEKDIKEFFNKMKMINGDMVKLLEIPLMPHSMMGFGKLLGMQEQVNIAVEDARLFLEEKWSEADNLQITT
ncbi:hypothetical protein HIM_04916 [Hirsutella minnesotensis 3608]|uniref:Alpha/beta hydrolase fold-3 domain-containing protein n=1 Tax=Hirsutella minnesotensis 3608 TaxID=1043627 RepID=A0A0F8A5Q9_9HYPO|nr:hypothetical protein HIM_04916 [Hirsutella minnesotensis 3608]